METGNRKVGLDQTGLDVGHAHIRVGHVNTQPVAQGLHCRLSGTVNVTASIGGIASHTADVHHMAAVTFHHARHDEACHRQQALDVCVNHRVPVIIAAGVFGFQTPCASCVVDQYVNLLPLDGQALDGRCCSLAVAHVKRQR